MAYVPLLKTLHNLLRNKAVLAEVSPYTYSAVNKYLPSYDITPTSSFMAFQVESGHKSESEFLEDYCDGEAFTSHPLFSVQFNALQIFFYYDDIEVCNPLGSKAKIHKLG